RTSREYARNVEGARSGQGRAPWVNGGSGRGSWQALQAECDLELVEGTEADRGAGRLARGEHRDGRDAHDSVVHRGVGVGGDIELDDLDLARVLRGELVDLRSDHATRPAPRCPKIHDHRLVALEDDLLPGGIGHFANVG